MDGQKPRAFRLTPVPEPEANPADQPRPGRMVAEILPEPDAFAVPTVATEAVAPVARGRVSWLARLFWSATVGLVSLAVSLSLYRLIEDLAAAHPVIGMVGAGLLAVALLALLILIFREWRALARLADVERLREAAAGAVASDDGAKAREVVRHLAALHRDDPGLARARAELEGLNKEIVDGRALLARAERLLLQSADEKARLAIAAAAKRVSLVTAISPRAIVDLMFVLAQSVMLTRRIAEIYGARPGFLGFLKLGRSILSHLALTGGLAVTDSVVSQLVGHGLAARLSAKLGEGVLNGLLTARVGLACIAATRPMPFVALEEPRLQDVAGEVISDPLGRRNEA